MSKEKPCELCGGTKQVLVSKARQMGYTIAPNEPDDVLDEKLVPCPLCASQPKAVGLDEEKGRRAIVKILEGEIKGGYLADMDDFAELAEPSQVRDYLDILAGMIIKKLRPEIRELERADMERVFEAIEKLSVTPFGSYYDIKIRRGKYQALKSELLGKGEGE